MSAWTEHVARWKDCTACPLCQQRDRIVLARGQVPCDVLFVGEAPGASEDALGLPFKGPAGKVLDDIIARATSDLNVTIAMTNLVCCFPRDAKMRGDGNHEPEYSEIVACRPRLHEFIGIVAPKIIVCVGSLATGHIGQHDAYGKVFGAVVVDIIHPAATFPPRMSRVAAYNAINHAVVKVRSAVIDMLQ